MCRLRSRPSPERDVACVRRFVFSLPAGGSVACVVVLLFAPTVVLVRLLSVYTVVRVLNVASDECVCVRV